LHSVSGPTTPPEQIHLSHERWWQQQHLLAGQLIQYASYSALQDVQNIPTNQCNTTTTLPSSSLSSSTYIGAVPAAYAGELVHKHLVRWQRGISKGINTVCAKSS
jgi:hypothetical protein